jgi:hypothetical protein
MNSKAVFEVKVETERNVVRVSYSGKVLATHMPAAVGEVERLLPQLQTGFVVFTDLSDLDSMELECGQYISRIMDLCKARGVGLVIRVIPNQTKDIGLNILSLTHYRGQVQIVTCENVEEAERALPMPTPKGA